MSVADLDRAEFTSFLGTQRTCSVAMRSRVRRGREDSGPLPILIRSLYMVLLSMVTAYTYQLAPNLPPPLAPACPYHSFRAHTRHTLAVKTLGMPAKSVYKVFQKVDQGTGAALSLR